MLYLKNMTTQSTTQKETSETLETALTTQPIGPYVSTCVGNALQEGLILLGQQGGVLYDTQGSIIRKRQGTTIDNIKYLITSLTPNPLNTPWYPCLNASSPPGYCKFSNNISEFSELYGPLYSYGFNKMYPLDMGAKTIKEQLEIYIATHTENCANITSLLDIPEFAGYNITAEEPKAEIIFGSRDVSVILKYPIKMHIKENTISKTVPYSAKINVRFAKIYNAVDDMITKDNKYLEYELIDDTTYGFFIDQNGTSHSSDFRELIGAELTKANNIITIKDTLSIIDSQPYIFQFAIQNRAPVLDYINESLVIDQGQQPTISPTATDPDEDPIAYNIQGLNQLSVGLNTIKVSASDPQFTDYQNIEILVCSINNTGKNQKCDDECGASSNCNNLPIGLTNNCNTNTNKTYICNNRCLYVDSTINCTI